MRLYRLGDAGEPVADIQDRLSALGFKCTDDPRGEFAEPTKSAVVAFQKSRGLTPDGIVGPETWRSLYEAGYRLGDRLLVQRRPLMRGEDVAELQRRLNSLGFDAGKPDGLYGPGTERAILDFQRNRQLLADGIAGPEVMTELQLVTRITQLGRESLREMEWLRRLPPTLVGTRVFFDPACRNHDEAHASWQAATAAAVALQERGGLPVVSRAEDTSFPERIRAGRANRLGSDVVISFQLADNAVYYFESAHGRSEAGALLAKHIKRRLGGTVEGRATAILKETRAPAIVVARTDLGSETGKATVDGLQSFFVTQGGKSEALPSAASPTLK